jgi:hypothetical protein
VDIHAKTSLLALGEMLAVTPDEAGKLVVSPTVRSV